MVFVLIRSNMNKTEITLSAYSDVSYADNLGTRRSTSGFVVFLNKNPVTWASQRQPIFATSSTESNYIASADCLKNVFFFRTSAEELTG